MGEFYWCENCPARDLGCRRRLGPGRDLHALGGPPRPDSVACRVELTDIFLTSYAGPVGAGLSRTKHL
jgi:hypothetical protein